MSATTPEKATTGRMNTAASLKQPAARMKFFLQNGVYVALEEANPAQNAERKWDRVVLTERTLTYISCRNGRVDRYVKSSPKSQVGSMPVEEYLKKAVVGMVQP